MSDHHIEVRSIEAEDWAALRAIRLDALADSPTAYITTHAEAAAFDDDLWRERARTGADGTTQMTTLAFMDDAVVGMAVGLDRRDVAPGVVAIVSVFVAPVARRRGVARRMMADVEAWARTRGASETSLWVVEGNDPAMAMYQSLGYQLTLDRQKITVAPVRWEVRLRKRFSGG